MQSIEFLGLRKLGTSVRMRIDGATASAGISNTSVRLACSRAQNANGPSGHHVPPLGLRHMEC